MLLARVMPPYAQIMILDPTAKIEVPLWPKKIPPFVATDTCILCACQPDIEGETDIAFGSTNEVRMEGLPIFDGVLKTPGHKIALETVEGDLIFALTTSTAKTLVRIWTNRLFCPNRVHIGVD